MVEETPYLLERLKKLIDSTRSHIDGSIEFKKREKGQTRTNGILKVVRSLSKF